MPGGVAVFADRIAKSLHDRGMLESVITPVRQTGDLSYPVIELGTYRTQRVLPRFLHRVLRRFANRLQIQRLVRTLMRNAPPESPQVLWLTSVDAYFGPQVLGAVRRSDVRFWVLLHGKDIIDLSISHHWLLQRLAASAEKLIFNSIATKRLFESKVTSAAGSCHILNPVPDFCGLEKIKRDPLNMPLLEGRTIFCSVCRLVERKGLHLAIKAFRELQAAGEMNGVVYVIAGEGEERTNLETLAGDEAGRSIFFLGMISEGKKRSLLECSTAFLHPNFARGDTDFEGFGISLVEAAWFGCAVLGGDQGGVAEAIHGLPDCVIASMEDPDQGLALVKKFMTDNRAREKQQSHLCKVQTALRERFDFQSQLDLVLERG